MPSTRNTFTDLRIVLTLAAYVRFPQSHYISRNRNSCRRLLDASLAYTFFFLFGVSVSNSCICINSVLFFVDVSAVCLH